MANCFCGCGRSIGFGHRRRANRLGDKLLTAVPLAQAVAALPAHANDRELAELSATGPAKLAEVTRYVHGEVDRDAVDSDGINAWNARWLHVGPKLAMEATKDWIGLNPYKVARTVLLGTHAPATLVEVRDTGTTINEDPRVELRFRVEPEGAAGFQASRKLTVSRIAVPKKGLRIDVAYDPSDDDRKITFRRADLEGLAAAEPPSDDDVNALAQLASLHASGALNDTEFTAAKARVLGTETAGSNSEAVPRSGA